MTDQMIDTAGLTKAEQNAFAGMLAYEVRVLILNAQAFVAEQWPEATLPGVLFGGVQFAKENGNVVAGGAIAAVHDMIVGMNALLKNTEEVSE